jgi:hypothetical protein
MNELLAVYAEIVKAATDDQILQHLTNFLTDAKDLEVAVKAVIDQAKQRAAAQQ